MDTVEIKECVITTPTRRGDGESKANPIRVITEVWDRDGKRIAEYDPCTFAESRAETFIRWLMAEGKIVIPESTGPYMGDPKDLKITYK